MQFLLQAGSRAGRTLASDVGRPMRIQKHPLLLREESGEEGKRERERERERENMVGKAQVHASA